MENANNKINLIGEVVSEPKFSHEIMGEGFYLFYIKCSRKSSAVDTLPVTVSDRLVNINEIKVGSLIEIIGQIRSYNQHIGEKSKCILYVFALSANVFADNVEISTTYNNSVELTGFLCKPPVYRVTPNGREIIDLILAVNRAYSKSDYIPCIAWGRNARYIGDLAVGDKIALAGRFQSREYQKKINEEQVETRTAYEVSVAKAEMIANSEE